MSKIKTGKLMFVSLKTIYDCCNEIIKNTYHNLTNGTLISKLKLFGDSSDNDFLTINSKYAEPGVRRYKSGASYGNYPLIDKELCIIAGESSFTTGKVITKDGRYLSSKYPTMWDFITGIESSFKGMKQFTIYHNSNTGDDELVIFRKNISLTNIDYGKTPIDLQNQKVKVGYKYCENIKVVIPNKNWDFSTNEVVNKNHSSDETRAAVTTVFNDVSDVLEFSDTYIYSEDSYVNFNAIYEILDTSATERNFGAVVWALNVDTLPKDNIFEYDTGMTKEKFIIDYFTFCKDSIKNSFHAKLANENKVLIGKSNNVFAECTATADIIDYNDLGTQVQLDLNAGLENDITALTSGKGFITSVSTDNLQSGIFKVNVFCKGA